MEITAQIRRDLGFEDVVRFEHHITETYKSIVRQPYDRLEELVEIADRVANISAKHEAVNRTARALTENGLAFIAAQNLHYR